MSFTASPFHNGAVWTEAVIHDIRLKSHHIFHDSRQMTDIAPHIRHFPPFIPAAPPNFSPSPPQHGSISLPAVPTHGTRTLTHRGRTPLAT